MSAAWANEATAKRRTMNRHIGIEEDNLERRDSLANQNLAAPGPNRPLQKRAEAAHLPFFSMMLGQFASAFFRFPAVSLLKSLRTPWLYCSRSRPSTI